MFHENQTKEVDEIVERVLSIIENKTDGGHTVQHVARLEEAHFATSQLITSLQAEHQAASNRMTHIEEVHIAASQRMDKIEAAIESNATSIKELNTAVSNIFNIVSISQQNFEVIQKNFEVVVGQIKGLQSENRNILDHLFGIQE
jgi:HD superfamily phosphodiesterase